DRIAHHRGAGAARAARRTRRELRQQFRARRLRSGHRARRRRRRGLAWVTRGRHRDRALPAPDPTDRDLMEARADAADTLRHVVSDAPRVMVVDGSRLVRKLIGDVLLREVPRAQVLSCGGLAEARETLADGPVDLVTTSLLLPDGDGTALAHAVREAAGQSYVPVIVVSGDVQPRLAARRPPGAVPDSSDKPP